jgi:hypothetical protein
LSSGNVLTAKSLTDTTLPAVGERPPVFGEGFRSLDSLLATHRDVFSGAPLSAFTMLLLQNIPLKYGDRSVITVQ